MGRRDLKEIEYFDGKKRKILAKVCKSPWCKFAGLMFRRDSPPLLFVFDKEQRIDIHSLFCRPFLAIWLDKNFKTTKKEEISRIKLSSGKGKYLLEIPLK